MHSNAVDLHLGTVFLHVFAIMETCLWYNHMEEQCSLHVV